MRTEAGTDTGTGEIPVLYFQSTNIRKMETAIVATHLDASHESIQFTRPVSRSLAIDGAEYDDLITAPQTH